MYKYFMLYALGILVPGLAFVVWRWPAGLDKTLSQHVASRKSSILYYFFLFLVVLPIMYLFFARYFVPVFHLSEVVLYLVAVSCLTQIGCTLIPEIGGRKTVVHQTLAGISALSLIAVLLYLMVTNGIAMQAKFVVGICVFLMILIVGFIALRRRTSLPVLLLQSGYFTLFFVAILSVAY